MRGYTGIQAALAALVFVAALLAGPNARAGDVRIIVSDSTPYYRDVADYLLAYLGRVHPPQTVSLHRIGDTLLVCIGTPASIAAAQRFPHHPQLHLFITRAAWRALRGEGAKSHKANLYIDQPVARLVALAQVVAPDARRAATVLGPVSAGEEQPPRAAAAGAGAGLELLTATIAADSSPLAVLTPLMEGADVFIALPDTAAINRNVAMWTLYLAFRHKIPVIGFSEAYTEAGAAVSLYTSTSDISRQAVEWLERFFADSHAPLWRSYPPRYFTLGVNPSVMRTLGLDMRAPGPLHDAVRQRLEEISR